MAAIQISVDYVFVKTNAHERQCVRKPLRQHSKYTQIYVCIFMVNAQCFLVSRPAISKLWEHSPPT